jgi:vacuolar-type H+-ATPase subunit C/Vma6
MLSAERITRMVDAPDFESAFSVLNESGYVRLLDRLSSPFNYEELLKMELAELRKLTDWAAPDSEVLRAIWLKYDLQKLEGGEKKYFEILRKTAERAGVPLFGEYVKSKIDTANIKILFRARDAGMSREDVKNAVIPGGAIDESRFVEYFGLSPEEIAQKLRYTDYSEALSGSPHVLERLLSGHSLRIIKEAKHVTFGIEPVLGFVLAKEHEIKILRMIFTSKLSGIAPEVLRERIALYYV